MSSVVVFVLWLVIVTICPLLQMDVALAAKELKTVKVEMSHKLMEVSGRLFSFILAILSPFQTFFISPD